MVNASPLYVEHTTRISSDRSEMQRLARQVRSLQHRLAQANKEIELLSAERDELVEAIKSWANDERA